MRILIVVPQQDRISGNWVTAHRFQRGLESLGHKVRLFATTLHDQGSLRETIHDFVPEVALLLHAYRSGKPWLESHADLPVPNVVLLTGTDINHDLSHPERAAIIRTVLQQASAVLLQNPLIAEQFRSSHPELAGNLRRLSPGITLGSRSYDLRAEHPLAKGKTLFLCPAGLRPVKGLLELTELFDRLADKSSSFHLAFCGPVLDEDYSKRLQEEIDRRPWTSYLGAIPADAMASAMAGADVVVNNSQSEGLANALLEAATLGIPILARRIPGNVAVVEHQVNGLLYANETEFTQFARALLDRERRQQLSRPDPERYHPQHETRELLSILEEAVLSSSGHAD